MQLIILDRDGVINEDPQDYLRAPADWRPIRGSLEAIARLHRAGWRVVIAMNQPGIATGLPDPDTLARINKAMLRQVRESGGFIDAVFFCPHAPEDRCNCRKPATGLLQDIASRLHTRIDQVPVVGDSLNDLQAARAAGARPVLVKTGKGFGTVGLPDFEPDTPVFNDLYEVVDHLLGSTHAQ